MDGRLAQQLTIPGGETISGPLSNSTVSNFSGGITMGEIIGRAIPFIFGFAGMALLLMLMVGGLRMLSSGDNPKRIEDGKQQITYAIVGFILVFMAYWVVQIVGLMFGITEFTDIFPL